MENASHTSDDKWKQSRVMVVETLTIWCSEINGHCEVNLSPETDEQGGGQDAVNKREAGEAGAAV